MITCFLLFWWFFFFLILMVTFTDRNIDRGWIRHVGHCSMYKRYFCRSWDRYIQIQGSPSFRRDASLSQSNTYQWRTLRRSFGRKSKIIISMHFYCCDHFVARYILMWCYVTLHRYTLQMFESTKWILKDTDCMHVDKYDSIVPIVVKPPENTSLTKNMNEMEIGIIQQYQFSSSLQRMSVIVRASGSDDFRAYTKGSPEMIINLSKTETVPKDISLILNRFTRQGFRVIAMGRRATITKNSAEVICLCNSFFYITRSNRARLKNILTTRYLSKSAMCDCRYRNWLEK